MARTSFRWSNLPLTEAIAYFAQKQNVDTNSWRDLMGSDHHAAFVVAGAKGALLADLRAAVDRAISRGTDLSEFRADFDQTVAARGWLYNGGRDWRTDLIYQTNMRTAYSAGRREQMARTKAARPYRQWRHGGSADPRPEHLALDGVVVDADSDLAQRSLPSGYGCKCAWFSLSGRDLDRLGLEVQDIAADFVPIDEGWAATAPSAEELAQAAAARAAAGLPPELAAAVLADESVQQAIAELSQSPPITPESLIRLGEAALPLGFDTLQAFDQYDELKKMRQDWLAQNAAAARAAADAIRIDEPALFSVDERTWRDWMTEAFAISGGRGTGSLDELINERERGFAAPREPDGRGGELPGVINVGRGGSLQHRQRVLFHEIGHHIEYEDPSIQAAARAWLEGRATGPAQPLRELTDLDYDLSEIAYPDAFIDPYVGRVYDRGTTEVISMGFEHFSEPIKMLDLYQRDREHFLLILGVVSRV